MSVYGIKYRKGKTHEDLPHGTSWEWESCRRAFGLPSVLSRGAGRRYLARRDRYSGVSALNRHRNNQTRRKGSQCHNRCKTFLSRDRLHIPGGLDFARTNRMEKQARRRRSWKLFHLRIVSSFKRFRDIRIEFVDFGLRFFRITRQPVSCQTIIFGNISDVQNLIIIINNS